MIITKVNSYTRVQHKPGERIHILEAYSEFEKESIRRSENYNKEKKKRNNQDQIKLYRRFLNSVFADTKFISSRTFNQRILEKFNGNTTHYRKRMIDLGFIEEKKGLVKPLI